MSLSTPGRNQPCPCGSGKKYKRCCGATEAAGRRSQPHEGPRVGHASAVTLGKIADTFGSSLVMQQVAILRLQELANLLAERRGESANFDIWTLSDESGRQAASELLQLGPAAGSALTMLLENYSYFVDELFGGRVALLIADGLMPVSDLDDLLYGMDTAARDITTAIEIARQAVEQGEPPSWPEEQWANESWVPTR